MTKLNIRQNACMDTTVGIVAGVTVRIQGVFNLPMHPVNKSEEKRCFQVLSKTVSFHRESVEHLGSQHR